MAKKITPRKNFTDQFRQVYLNIVGRNLDPEYITITLGIEPDDSCYKGETYGKNKKAKQGYWCLEGHPSGTKFETQLKSIVKKIKPVKNKLLRVVRSSNVERAYLTIAMEPSSEVVVAGYCFDAELINIFTSLGIDIALAIHIPGKLAEGVRS